MLSVEDKLHKKHKIEDELPSFPGGPRSLAQVLDYSFKDEARLQDIHLVVRLPLELF